MEVWEKQNLLQLTRFLAYQAFLTQNNLYITEAETLNGNLKIVSQLPVPAVRPSFYIVAVLMAPSRFLQQMLPFLWTSISRVVQA